MKKIYVFIILSVVLVTITRAQNVGIGTTNPQSKLDVEGGLSIGTGYSGTYTAPSNGAIVEGEVGIGTSGPLAQLHVINDMAVEASTSDYANTAFNNFNGLVLHSYRETGFGNRVQLIATRSNAGNWSSQMEFYTAPDGSTVPQQRMTIDRYGDVGIGVTDPQALLHVSTETSGDAEMIIEADSDNNNENDNPRLIFAQDGSEQQAAIYKGNNDLIIANAAGSGDRNIIFSTGTGSSYTAATERMRIEENGDVVIDNLTGSGTRMVTADAGGQLSTQAIPSGGDNLGNHLATQDIEMDNNDINGINWLRWGDDGEGLEYPGGQQFYLDNNDEWYFTSGNVNIGSSSSTNNDLYISNHLVDWDNSSFYLDPNSTSELNNVNLDDIDVDGTITFDFANADGNIDMDQYDITDADEVNADRINIEGSNGYIHHGPTGLAGLANGWTPDHSDGDGIWLEDNSGEAGGFYADGNVAAIWTPGDGALLDVYDEDIISEPQFTIDGSGNVLPGETDNGHDLGNSSYAWRDLHLDGGFRIDGSFGSSGQVLKSNGSEVYWGTDNSGGDNLGNHSATTSIDLNGYNLNDVDVINMNNTDIRNANEIEISDEDEGIIYPSHGNAEFAFDASGDDHWDMSQGGLRIKDDVWIDETSTAFFGQADGFNFGGSTGGTIEQGVSESSGFHFNGDHTHIWAPDGEILSIYDEDGMDLDFYFDDGGNAYADIAWNTFSDSSLKVNITTIESPLDKVMQLRGVTYDMKDEFYFKGDIEAGKEVNYSEADNKIGFIAQEMETVLPQLVTTSNHEQRKGVKAVNYDGVIPVLVEAMKEMNTKVESLEKENQQLKQELNALKTE